MTNSISIPVKRQGLRISNADLVESKGVIADNDAMRRVSWISCPSHPIFGAIRKDITAFTLLQYLPLG